MARDVSHITGAQAVPAQRRRPRGGAIVDKFLSTDDITHPEVPLSRKKLALFLMVELVDDNGQMTSAYDAVISYFAETPGHWTRGKSRAVLQKACGRFLGCGTEPVKLHWSKVRDLLVASGRVAALPEAAYLFCQVVGLAEPEEGYRGEKRRPVWDEDDATVVTSYDVGGRTWALRFWDEVRVDAMTPAPASSAPATNDGVPAQVSALLQRLQQHERHEDALRGEIGGLREALRDSWLELNRMISMVSTWQKRAEEAERTLTAREVDMAKQHELVQRARAAVEEQQRGLDHLVRSTEEHAAELVRKAKQDYGQEVWKLQGKIAELQRAIKTLEDENLLRRRQVWALRDDVLASLKRRNPAASPDTLLKLLEDILPAGVDVEMSADDIVKEKATPTVEACDGEGNGPPF